MDGYSINSISYCNEYFFTGKNRSLEAVTLTFITFEQKMIYIHISTYNDWFQRIILSLKHAFLMFQTKSV